MLIEHSGDVIRTLRLGEGLAKVGRDPQPWQFKPFADAASLGVELVWPFDDYLYPGSDSDEVDIEKVSPMVFIVRFPSHVRVKENHSLFIFPHHSIAFDQMKAQEIVLPHYHRGSFPPDTPQPLPQMIEFDWWPGKLEVLFVNKPCQFRRGEPFAQAVVLPRRDYTVNKMTEPQEQEVIAASDFLEDHKSDYITRTVKTDDFPEQSNLYERLSQLNKQDGLPPAVKKKSADVRPRLNWI